MGIRLSMRKKGTSHEEYCLGKLYSYIETREEAEACESIAYLLRVGALDDLFGMFEDEMYDFKGTDAEKFADICDFCRYQDYGVFFELRKDQVREFVKLYAADWSRFWERKPWDGKDFDEVFEFMDSQTSLETSIFEFRLGA